MQRIIFCFSRTEELKFISHLDIIRTFRRAMRRAEIPLLYKQGFHPQPRLVIGVPLPVGVTAEGEYGEALLSAGYDPASFTERINKTLPAGLRIDRAAHMNVDDPPLMQLINTALYRAFLSGENAELSAGACGPGVEALLKENELKVEKKGKKGLKTRDIRPFIRSLRVVQEEGGSAALEMLLQTGSQGGAHPADVLALLGKKIGYDYSPQLFRIHRVGLFSCDGESCRPLLPGG